MIQKVLAGQRDYGPPGPYLVPVAAHVLDYFLVHEDGVVSDERLELGAVGRGRGTVAGHGVLPVHEDQVTCQLTLQHPSEVGYLFIGSCSLLTVDFQEGPAVCVCVCVCVYVCSHACVHV